MRYQRLVLLFSLCLGSFPAAGQSIRVSPKAGGVVQKVSAIPSSLRGSLTAPSLSALAGVSLLPGGIALTPSIAAPEAPGVAVQGAPIPLLSPAIPASVPTAVPNKDPLYTLKAISETAPSSKDPAEAEEQSKGFWRQALGEAPAAPDAQEPAAAVPGSAGAVPGTGAGEDTAQAWNRLNAERSSPENQARWNAALTEARKNTAADVARLLKMRKAGPKVHAELAASDTKTITEYRGVPGRIAALSEDGRIYRHWVRDSADLESILASGLLRAGNVSYVEFTGSHRAYIKDIYLDLHGPFFTATENTASEPRVMNEDVHHYVDFRLPPGVRALSLDGSDVMMIPSAPGTYLPIEIAGSSLAPR
ncbi:MAG: hypothetical protein WC943_09495 [Elusimicrobiota bacterium]|jgi:hypothetical protein